MILFAVFCVYTIIGSLETWKFPRNNQYDLLESWAIKRVLGNEIQRKFQDQIKPPQRKLSTCKYVHKTSDTPFIAVVLFKTSGRFFCMGTIIDHQHVLTVRSCYEKVEPFELKVLTGCYKAYWAEDSQILSVTKIIRHEYFVAMLRLKSALKFTNYIQPVKFPPSASAVVSEFENYFPPPYNLVGFPIDRYDVPGDFLSKDKYYKIYEETFVPFEKCLKNYSKLILEEDKLFCIIGEGAICWGSLGAPVLKWRATEGHYLQVGVVVADNCTSSETGPLLVARTDVFAEWIYAFSFESHQPL